MVVELPIQIIAFVAEAVTVGLEFTVTVTQAVFIHDPTEPVTVYVVVIAGLASTLLPVFVLRPVFGDQS